MLQELRQTLDEIFETTYDVVLISNSSCLLKVYLGRTQYDIIIYEVDIDKFSVSMKCFAGKYEPMDSEIIYYPVTHELGILCDKKGIIQSILRLLVEGVRANGNV